ncbi:hypothetical protein JTE90_018450 [Oedothorax gibbosus]|uniref:Leucine-rich repeat-containing protein 15 n=1 Tax=Oedothorax gibbosus TaxID=931172 RepID=A0AAV6UZE7_9ARAC|nr:hypothetical protein JTE90_018450 [Oedothorax gibbosus]
MNFAIVILLLLQNSSSDIIPVCPHSCYCDDRGEYVSCEGSGNPDFPENLPESTIRLELRNYAIPELRHEHLLRLSSLEELHIQNSGLGFLEEGAFVSSSRLQKLDLSRNQISILNDSSFEYLDILRHLDLSSNKIESTEDAFKPLSNLEQLYLKDNLLSQLTTQTFDGLHKIQYLNLDSNNISTIEVGTFQYLTNLARLVISNNPLTTLSRLDFFGSRLQYIDVSLAGLSRIPQTLTRFVRDLRLAGNDLSQIGAGDLDSYPYLGLLVLDDNCIKEIENDALGRLEYLMRLWLNGNCLTSVPPNLPPSLLALYLEENKLTSLPSYSFRGLTNLEQLFLQRNMIVDIQPCAFCDLVNLKSLDLQANQIADLSSEVFESLEHLEMLDLSQNNIKWIYPLCFNRLRSLTTLQMSRVHTLVEMEDTVFDSLLNLQILEVYDSPHLVQRMLNSTRMLHGLRSLKEFNLMHNYITRLRSDFPSFFPSLRVVKLSGNLWNCDENIKWLSDWIKQSVIQFYSSYNIRCAIPESLKSKPLMMLTDRDIQNDTLLDLPAVIPTNEIFTNLSNETTLATTKTKNFINSEPSKTLRFTSTSNVLEPSHIKRYLSTTSSSTDLRLDTATEVEATSTETRSTQSIVTRTIPLPSVFTTTPKSKTVFDDSLKVTELSTSSTTFLQEQGNKSKRLSQSNNHATNISTKKINPPQPESSSPASSTKESIKLVIPSSTISMPTSTATAKVVSEPNPVVSSSPKSNKTHSRSPGLFNATAFARTSTKAFSSSDAYAGRETKAYYLGLVILASVILFAVVVGFAALGAVRVFRRPYHPVKRSSISYYPQTDEVSIVTLTEGTVGLRTGTHRGLGNKLYYIMEDGKVVNCEGSSHDPQLQELLPTSPPENSRLY